MKSVSGLLIAALVLGLLAFAAYRYSPYGRAWRFGQPRVQKQLIELEGILSMRRLTIRGNSKFLPINLAVDVRPTCTPGDFDALASDLVWRPKAQILVTVEPISGLNSKSSPIAVVKTNIKQMQDGLRIPNIPIPRTTIPEAYGVYVCIDSTQANRCNQKVAVTFRQFLVQNSLAMQDSGKGAANYQDKIFYHQIFFAGDSLKLASSPWHQDQHTYMMLANYLNLHWESAEAAKGAATKVMEHYAMGSLPLEYSADTQTLTAPMPQQRFERGCR